MSDAYEIEIGDLKDQIKELEENKYGDCPYCKIKGQDYRDKLRIKDARIKELEEDILCMKKGYHLIDIEMQLEEANEIIREIDRLYDLLRVNSLIREYQKKYPKE